MITKLTKEQEARFPKFIDKWIKVGLSTEPANKAKAEEAVRGLYQFAKLNQPKIIWCPCPLSGAMSAVVIAKLLHVRSAVDSAVSSAVRSAIESAVRSAVDSAVHSAVYSAVHSAVYSAVDSAVGSAVHSAIGSAVDSAVGSAVGSAIESAVGGAVDSAVYSAVRSAVDSAVGSAVDSAVHSAVRLAVNSAVGSAIESAVNSAVGGAVDSAVGGVVGSAVRSAVGSAGRSFWGGSLWSGYSSWADFFNIVCNVTIDRNFLDMVENCGYYWVLNGLAILTDRPETINRNPAGQLHNTNGMAIKYRSGWGLYSLNGVIVPEWLVMKKDTEIDPQELLKIDNVEVRREFVRKVGYDRIFYKLGGKVIDKKELLISNGTEMFKHIYEVVRLQSSGPNWTALKMINPSLSTPDNQVYHIEGLPNNCDTVEKAINFRKPDKMKKIKVDNKGGEDYYQHGDVCVWPAGAKSLKMYPTILA